MRLSLAASSNTNSTWVVAPSEARMHMILYADGFRFPTSALSQRQALFLSFSDAASTLATNLKSANSGRQVT